MLAVRMIENMMRSPDQHGQIDSAAPVGDLLIMTQAKQEAPLFLIFFRLMAFI